MRKSYSLPQRFFARVENPQSVTRRIATAIAVVAALVLTTVVISSQPTEAATSASAAAPDDVVGSMSVAPSGCVLYRVVNANPYEGAAGKYVLGKKRRPFTLGAADNALSVMCGKAGNKAKLRVQTGLNSEGKPTYQNVTPAVVVPPKAYGYKGRMRLKSNCSLIFRVTNPDERARWFEIWVSSESASPSSAQFRVKVPSHVAERFVFDGSGLGKGTLLTAKVNAPSGPQLLDYKLQAHPAC